jgi:hypothetical protein
MKGFFKRVSPRAAVADFLDVWRGENKHRWLTLGVAMSATFAMFVMFLPDSERIAPAPPEITYITTFEAGRSDAEIAASNAANQARQEELAAAQEARIERRKDLYRALGRATGLDVDEMEAEIAREEAAEEAAGAAAEQGTAEGGNAGE